MGYSSVVIFRYLKLPRLSCSPRPEQKQLRCSQVTDAKEGEEERKNVHAGSSLSWTLCKCQEWRWYPEFPSTSRQKLDKKIVPPAHWQKRVKQHHRYMSKEQTSRVSGEAGSLPVSEEASAGRAGV